MESKKRPSNYELQVEEWQRRFLRMDLAELCRRLPELTIENDDLKITQFGRRCAVSLKTGQIRDLDEPTAELSIGEIFNIFTLFAYAKPDAALSGEWLAFADLKDAAVFGPAFKRGTLASFARMFSGRPEALVRGCEALGGVRLSVGDVGYELKAFECIPMRVIFWDSDDEFEAQANILFDRSATDFIHVESTVTIADVGVMRIAQAAGIEPHTGYEMQ